jgi:hypothetical protein
VLASNKFSDKKIKRINYYRLYLNVVLVSDMTDASGTAIHPAYYTGDMDSLPTSTEHLPVVQTQPGDKALKAWQEALKLLCNPRTKKLHQPLGKWITPLEDRRRTWTHYYCPPTDTIYQSTGSGYSMHQKLTSTYDQDPVHETQDLPDEAVPVDLRERPGVWDIVGYKQQLLPTRINPTTIHGTIATLDSWEKYLLDNLEWDKDFDGTTVWQHLSSSSCTLVSDGSAQDCQGSFGWIISTASGTRLARGWGPVFGAKVNSYRAEGYGILAGLRFLVWMQKLYSTPAQPKLAKHNQYCDNKSMVEVCNKYQAYPTVYPNATLGSEWDVIAQIKATYSELQDELDQELPTLTHVKGHQDEKIPYEDLPLPAQLNVDCDKLADEAMQQYSVQDCKLVPIFPASGCQVELASSTITYNLKHELKLARTTPPLKRRLCHKNSWGIEQFESIDWQSHGQALKKHETHRPTMVKYLCNWLPVGHMVSRYHDKYQQGCPSCQESDEKQEHLLHCPSREKWRQQCLDAVLKELEDPRMKTAPALKQLFMAILYRSLLDPTNALPIQAPEGLQPISDAQHALGWQQVLKGRLVKDWAIYQQQYRSQNQGPKEKLKGTEGTTWATRIISTILGQVFECWQLRNGDRHGQDKESQMRAEKAQALHELQLLYDEKDNVPTQHQWLFNIPIQARMQWHTSQLRQWLNSWAPVIFGKHHSTALETG